MPLRRGPGDLCLAMFCRSRTGVELRGELPMVPIPKTMKVGKGRFAGLTLSSGTTQTQPMMVLNPKVKPFLY